MMSKIKYIIFLLLIIFTSCTNKHFYSQSLKIPKQKWFRDSLMYFKVPITDTSALYNIYIKLKHNDNYPYQNLWIKIFIKAPCGKTMIDTLNLWLTDEESRWIGKAIGKQWTIIIPYQDSIKVKTPGDFEFYIAHIMRKNPVTDISELGLIFDKINPKSANHGKR